MAAADANSLIVLFLSGNSYRRRYELDLLRELQQKGMGKKIIVVCDGTDGLGKSPSTGPVTDVMDYGPVPGVTDDVRAPLLAVTGQLLGLFFSLSAGLRPDTPSPSGIITRVVQGVRIHPYSER
jgi:tagatose-6-phosphate ketose/aldose isomerase